MRFLFISLFVCLSIGCSNKRWNKSFEKNSFLVKAQNINSVIQKNDSSKLTDSIFLDSIYRGASFYAIKALREYQFIDIDPYENFMIHDNEMYNIIVYEKDNNEYAILVLLEENIGMGELSPEWKKTKKIIVDYIIYSRKYKRCWYHSFKNDADIECGLYVIMDSLHSEFKSWKIDYNKQKFIPSNRNINIECY